MWAGLEVYWSFVRLAFLSMLAYRLRYFTGIFTYVLFISVNYFIWKAVYSSLPEGARLNGFTLSEIVTYISVAWIARSFYFSSIDEDLDELVRSGQVSVFLMRPVNFHLMLLSQAAGESLFRILFFTGPICLTVALLFPLSLPASLFDTCCFLLASLLSFLIMAEINFMVGLLAFVLKSIQGISRAKYFLLQLFSGLLMPLAFFPSWFRAFCDVLPFKAITYTPLQFYLGKIVGWDVLMAFGGQLLWALVLVYCSSLALKAAMRKLTLQGG